MPKEYDQILCNAESYLGCIEREKVANTGRIKDQKRMEGHSMPLWASQYQRISSLSMGTYHSRTITVSEQREKNSQFQTSALSNGSLEVHLSMVPG